MRKICLITVILLMMLTAPVYAFDIDQINTKFKPEPHSPIIIGECESNGMTLILKLFLGIHRYYYIYWVKF